MYKNDAGLTVLETGDVVKVGNGKTRYTVVEVLESGTPIVESQSSGRVQQINPERVSVVENVRAKAVAELNLPVTDEGTFKDEPVREQTSYQKAILFALNKLGKHVYTGTAKDRPARKARKLAKQARRNQRKAAKK